MDDGGGVWLGALGGQGAGEADAGGVIVGDGDVVLALGIREAGDAPAFVDGITVRADAHGMGFVVFGDAVVFDGDGDAGGGGAGGGTGGEGEGIGGWVPAAAVGGDGGSVDGNVGGGSVKVGQGDGNAGAAVQHQRQAADGGGIGEGDRQVDAGVGAFGDGGGDDGGIRRGDGGGRHGELQGVVVGEDGQAVASGRDAPGLGGQVVAEQGEVEVFVRLGDFVIDDVDGQFDGAAEGGNVGRADGKGQAGQAVGEGGIGVAGAGAGFGDDVGGQGEGGGGLVWHPDLQVVGEGAGRGGVFMDGGGGGVELDAVELVVGDGEVEAVFGLQGGNAAPIIGEVGGGLDVEFEGLGVALGLVVVEDGDAHGGGGGAFGDSGDVVGVGRGVKAGAAGGGGADEFEGEVIDIVGAALAGGDKPELQRQAAGGGRVVEGDGHVDGVVGIVFADGGALVGGVEFDDVVVVADGHGVGGAV